MNLISLADWSREQIEGAVRLALQIKKAPIEYAHSLEDRILLMIFQKPSLRTRLSFEAAMLQTGGHAIHYDLASSPWSLGKESLRDTARTASRYVSAIMARLADPAHMGELAEGATVPVINGLTDFEHPCQVMGDLLTVLERKGRLQHVKVAYVGDANNNVTHSLLDGCAKLGLDITLGCPRTEEYEPSPAVLHRAREFAQASGSGISVFYDAWKAVSGADVVYTDTWMSYHIPPAKRERRVRDLNPFRVTTELMAAARPDAIFMHCLPAQRGVEVDDAVLDGPWSVVFDQAENRLHSQKAILMTLLR